MNRGILIKSTIRIKEHLIIRMLKDKKIDIIEIRILGIKITIIIIDRMLITKTFIIINQTQNCPLNRIARPISNPTPARN